MKMKMRMMPTKTKLMTPPKLRTQKYAGLSSAYFLLGEHGREHVFEIVSSQRFHHWFFELFKAG